MRPEADTPHDVPSERPRRRGDRGFSLVEIIVSITLMGTIVIATLNAVTTTVRASSTSRYAAQAETAVVNAADRVNRAPKRCDYTIYAQAAVQTAGWPPESASVTQEYYVPASDPTQPGTWQTGAAGSPACSASAPTDLLVQRVTIHITTPEKGIQRSIQVVKSDV